VTCIARRAPFRITTLDLVPRLDGTRGVLDIVVGFDRAIAAPVELTCAGASLVLDRTAADRFSGRLVLDGIAPWWPHT
ncbi:hypothetical protein, partial [Acinetobacter baumannii]|uniref:hypothetical protein n=1 Tax=Acinetobacter baumannii TaxID=470 RepID=UPI0013D7347B